LRAFFHIKPEPVYRREAFIAGLERVGYRIHMYSVPQRVEDGDVLVIWNRYSQWHDMATKFEAGGGDVYVCENAYLGLDRANRQRYAIAKHGHNGSGCWPIGDGSRWQALGLPLQPWRERGDHVLICPNRSFGRPDMVMRPDWAAETKRTLQQFTRREIRIRPHPGNDAPKVPLSHDLENAWAVVVWTSSAGCEALVRGVPVYAMGPYWVLGGRTSTTGANSFPHGGLKTIDNPKLPDRQYAMERLAWAQWHVEEIAAGAPFQYLLNRPCAFAGGL
jgi:hypothetical protein